MQVGDAYLIVYSITDRASFEKASELRIQLRRARQTEDIPIILVGNKSDLVRCREVSISGKRSGANSIETIPGSPAFSFKQLFFLSSFMNLEPGTHSDALWSFMRTLYSQPVSSVLGAAPLFIWPTYRIPISPHPKVSLEFLQGRYHTQGLLAVPNLFSWSFLFSREMSRVQRSRSRSSIFVQDRWEL